jgi:hypothetical protein
MIIQNINYKNFFINNLRFASSTVLDLHLEKAPYEVTKHVIFDPYNNRKDIFKVAKNASGVYVFHSPEGGLYVGSSVELYSRVVHYFQPSVTAKSDRHVLHHFKKHGLDKLTLTLLILESGSSTEMVRVLEQYFIDTLLPNLNEELTVTRPGIPSKLSRKVYVYDNKTLRLVLISDSMLDLSNKLGLSRVTVRNCAALKILYLNRFVFSLEPISFGYTIDLMSVEALVDLIEKERTISRSFRSRGVQTSEAQPSSIAVFVENVNTPSLSQEYPSATKAAVALKCSPNTVLKYLNNPALLFRGKLKFTKIIKK